MKRKSKFGYGDDVPPLQGHVEIYFNQKGLDGLEAERFYTFYQMRDWENTNGNTIKDWKAEAFKWILEYISKTKGRNIL